MTLSSSRVIRGSQQTLGAQPIPVRVKIRNRAAGENIAPDMSRAVDEVLQRAKLEARAIIEQASAEVSALRQAAEDEGQQKGFDAGFHEGLEQAQAAWAAMKEELQKPLQIIQEVQQYTNRLADEATLALAAALTTTLYSRLKSERLDVLVAYIEEMVSAVNHDTVTLFLDPTWSPRMQALQDALSSTLPGLTLAVDEQLSQGVFRCEGDQGGILAGPLLSLQALVQETLTS